MSAGQKKRRSEFFFNSRSWRASDEGAFGGGLSSPYQGGIKRASARFFLFFFFFSFSFREAHPSIPRLLKLENYKKDKVEKNLANGIEFVLISTKKCRIKWIRVGEKRAGQRDRAGYPVEGRALVDPTFQVFSLNPKEW